MQDFILSKTSNGIKTVFNEKKTDSTTVLILVKDGSRNETFK